MPMFLNAHHRLLSLVVAIYILPPVSGTCFTPIGTDRNSESDAGNGNLYRPCNTGDEFSMCCALNREYPVDNCRHDGLCQNNNASEIWRESCTDPTWQSPSCLRLCITGMNSRGEAANGTDALVTQCDDKSICCGSNNTDCCVKNQGVWINNGEITEVNPSASSSSTASSTSFIETTASSASTSTPFNTDLTSSSSPSVSPLSSSGGSSHITGAIVGGVIGSVVGVVLIAGAAWYFSRQRKRARLQRSAPPYNAVSSANKGPTGPYELSEEDGDHELGGREVMELDGRVAGGQIKSHSPRL